MHRYAPATLRARRTMRRSAIGLEGGKPSLDLIEPRRPRRGEIEVHVWMVLEPAIALLMGVEIIEDDVQLAIREGGNHAVHETEEFDTAPPLGMLGNNPAAGDFERCKQGRGAVPLVIVALAGQGASVRELQVALRPLQRLDRRLLIDAENNRLGRRVDIETDHVGRFRRELRVIALAPGLAGSQIDVVLAQKAPNILNVNILQRHRQQRTRPAGVARRRRLIQKRQNASVRRLTVDWLLACPRAIIQSSKPMIGKAMPPFADNARLNAYFLGDRTCAAAFGRQQHYLRPLQVALRRARGPAARLKHFAYLRPEPNFSCFGNHPDLES